MAIDPLHPNGRCRCHGEGRCDWCRRHGSARERDARIESRRRARIAAHQPNVRALTDAREGQS